MVQSLGLLQVSCMESVYGAMKDLANKATIESELAELQAELDQIRLQLVDFQDQPSHCQDDISPPSTEHQPAADSEKVQPRTQLENLQRLLARSRGEE